MPVTFAESQQKFVDAIASLEGLTTATTLDSGLARANLEALQNEVEKLGRDLFSIEAPEERRNRQVQLPVTLRLFHYLCQDELQWYHQIKRSLAVATRALIEHAVFHSRDQGAHVYFETRERLLGGLRTVQSTLPKGEIRTYFELKCAKAAIKMLPVGQGGAKGLAKRHGSAFGEALFEVALSANGAPPYVSLAPLAAPLVALARDIFDSIEKSWYRPIWVCHSLNLGSAMRTVEDFQAIEEHLKEWKTNHKLAFYIALLFQKVIKNPEVVDVNLKRLLIAGSTDYTDSASRASSSSASAGAASSASSEVSTETSLVTLAQYQDRKRYKRTLGIKTKEVFWRVRLQALQTLSEVIPILTGSGRSRVIEIVLTPLSKEAKEHPLIVDAIPKFLTKIVSTTSEDERIAIRTVVEKTRKGWEEATTTLLEIERLPVFEQVEAELQPLAEQEPAVSGEGGALQAAEDERSCSEIEPDLQECRAAIETLEKELSEAATDKETLRKKYEELAEMERDFASLNQKMLAAIEREFDGTAAPTGSILETPLSPLSQQYAIARRKVKEIQINQARFQALLKIDSILPRPPKQE